MAFLLKFLDCGGSVFFWRRNHRASGFSLLRLPFLTFGTCAPRNRLLCRSRVVAADGVQHVRIQT